MVIKEKAYAKINLFLDVIGRRADGFHDVVTVMRSVSLCDDLQLDVSPSDKREICISSDEPSLECNQSNLIYRSAEKYMSHFGISDKLSIRLIKRIPIGAGLGGGSSDAAATLRALNKVYGRASDEQLASIAGEIGSDVSFCLKGGCAICTGRGEKITPISYSFYPYIVIAIGQGRVSTPAAYGLLDERYGDFVEYNKKSKVYHSSRVPLYNIFENVIDLSEVNGIKEIMKKCGAGGVLMSGSGPSVFGGFNSCIKAFLAQKALAKQGYSAYICRLK